jgi:AraC-like DNA-binding protein
VVGFSSLRYFSKVFKSIKGEIPSAYRKQDK